MTKFRLRINNKFFHQYEKIIMQKNMHKVKEYTILKNQNVIEEYLEDYLDEETKTCNLENGNFAIKFCDTKDDKNKWNAFVHLTTSLPYFGAVGRQCKYFLMCDDKIIGMVCLSSPLLQLGLRDNYLSILGKKSEYRYQKLNMCFNIAVCVSTRKYSPLLTGKCLVYSVFTYEIIEYLKSKYKMKKIIGFETTSLYGKSSMYSRLNFLKYLGLTQGYSAMCLNDNEWKKMREEYFRLFPNSRGTPLKFQVIDKLSSYYKRNNLIFPYNIKHQKYKRGIYFGFCRSPHVSFLNIKIQEWRNRWLLPRLSNGYSALNRVEIYDGQI